MKRLNLILVLKLALISTLISCEVSVDGTVTNPNEIDSIEWIKKGKHMVTIAGCNDCHTPKRMGAAGPEFITERLLSGYDSKNPLPEFDTILMQKGIAQMSPDMTAAAGPWGISFASNLTSDPSGAASWPFENFKRALKEGKSKGLSNNRMLLPPMPWQNYAAFSDDEVKAIYLYLKSIPKVENIVPQPKIAAQTD